MPFTRDTVPSTVYIAVGGALEVTLFAQTGGGYWWSADATGSGIFEVTEARERRDDAVGAVGAGTSQHFRLTAAAVGRGQVAFRHRRPWESAAVDEFLISVTVVGDAG